MVAVLPIFPINQIPHGWTMSNPSFWSNYNLLLDVSKARQTGGDKNSCEARCLLNNPRFRIHYYGDSAPSVDNTYLLTYQDAEFKPLPESSGCQPVTCYEGIYSALLNTVSVQMNPSLPWKPFEFEDAEHTQHLKIDTNEAKFTFRETEFTFDVGAISVVPINEYVN